MVSVELDFGKNEFEGVDLECPNTEHHKRFGSGWDTEFGATKDIHGNQCKPYEGCPACTEDSGSIEPLFSYGHIVEDHYMITDELRTKIASETPCALVESMDTEEWFIILTGAGMDFSPQIAYAYVLAQNRIPLDLLAGLNVTWCRQTLSSEQFTAVQECINENSAFIESILKGMRHAWETKKPSN